MATYKVTTKVEGAKPRLVEAKTKAQAIAHVVADTIAAEVCEIADAVKLGAEGVQIETAGDGGAA